MSAWDNNRTTDDHGRQMDTITFAFTKDDKRQTLTFPIGFNDGYRRTEGAACMEASRGPFKIEFDLNPDGTWTLRFVTTLPSAQGRFSGHSNHMHFARDEPLGRPKPTDAQIRTLARWFFQPEEHPFYMGDRLGADVQAWAFIDLNLNDIEKLSQDGLDPKRSYELSDR